MEGIKLRFNFAAISQRASRDTANISGAIYILNWRLLARRHKKSVVGVDSVLSCTKSIPAAPPRDLYEKSRDPRRHRDHT